MSQIKADIIGEIQGKDCTTRNLKKHYDSGFQRKQKELTDESYYQKLLSEGMDSREDDE